MVHIPKLISIVLQAEKTNIPSPSIMYTKYFYAGQKLRKNLFQRGNI